LTWDNCVGLIYARSEWPYMGRIHETCLNGSYRYCSYGGLISSSSCSHFDFSFICISLYIYKYKLKDGAHLFGSLCLKVVSRQPALETREKSTNVQSNCILRKWSSSSFLEHSPHSLERPCTISNLFTQCLSPHQNFEREREREREHASHPYNIET
jgi:hypothetical protein